MLNYFVILFGQNILIEIEKKIYHVMIGAKAFSCKNTNKMMHPKRKIYCVLFSFHEKFFIFNENMGISVTSNVLNNNTNAHNT